MKIAYITKRFSQASRGIVGQAQEIIDEYAAQGFGLTLRQLYYQFVARGLLANRQREYKRLGSIISDARRAGLIDWEAIVDRTRFLRSPSTWDSPQQIVRSCAQQFALDRWADQPYRIEVWIEKDALIGVLEAACKPWQIPYFSCRGYTSDSQAWRAAQRLAGYVAGGQQALVLHFGDHDPSGVDMTRDLRDRVAMFAEAPKIRIRRLALNMDQIERYKPPPNPAKLSDSRARAYIDEYGDDSWELDALDPATISALIDDEVRGLLDEPTWRDTVEREKEHRRQLAAVAQRWDEIVGQFDE